jgi:predicted outer membrane protein
MHRHRFVGSALVFPAAALVVAACGSSHPNSSSEQPLGDASPGENSSPGAGSRAPSLVPDGAVIDAAVNDAAVADAAVPDAAPSDSTSDATMEAGTMDAVASDAPVPVDAPADAASADSADAQALDDPQIMGILEGENTQEILESLLAMGNPDNGVDIGLEAGAPAFDAGAARSVNPSVVGYANMMAIDHAQSNSSLESLGIAPAQSRTQAMLQSDAQGAMARLQPLSGQAFDMAYAQDQVAFHTRLRDLVTGQLAPAARDSQLQMYLTGTLVPLIDVHLLAANALVAQLNDAGVPQPTVVIAPTIE